MSSRTRKTARKSTGPISVPCHQLAPRHEDNSSGSNDPIGDLEAQVEQLRSELHHYWGLVLKYFELRTRQHKMLNVNALRPSKH